MNLQQAAYLRSSANGFSKHKVEPSNRVENKLQPWKSNPIGVIGSGITSGSKGAVSEILPRDRLVYMTTCLIGHPLDVQVNNGSIYSGIFHATNADTDFGIILKMARLKKDVSFRGKSSGTDLVSKAPTKTLIIPAHELVQVVAKDVAVTRDGLSNELHGDIQQDIMLDSYISQSRHVDIGRELEPWVPDEDAPRCAELDNIFDSPWSRRNWDQFKVNEALFGVHSTFNEELYTTKLEKGPQMRKLEEEARRIAREIEGEETYDLHLAEERGAYPHANFDLDEETKYSSVFRGFDDSGYADEDVVVDSHDIETFGDSSVPGFIRSFADVTSGKTGKGLEGGRVSSGLSSKDEFHTIKFSASQELYRSISQLSDSSENAVCGFKDDGKKRITLMCKEESVLLRRLLERSFRQQILMEYVYVVIQPSLVSKKDGSEKGGVSSMMATSTVCIMVEEKKSASDLSTHKSAKLHVIELKNSRALAGRSTSSTSEIGAATLAPSAVALSPSSSVGSLSSEKSSLNPNAKEFRPNPNAKSFVPSRSLLRPVSPVNDASFYLPSTASSVPHMHGMPVGIGVGPSFAGHQPMLFNPQAATMQPQPPAYYPANGPQYGQQMIIGHPGQQVMYMPGYPAGREL
ncbi:hypothetical protein RND81_09G122200 [Saponaria officinalis]|uniref:LsmAD domain-containing protein n=1 Tax=Saponaria officinalis TaxID=3572 RepID=A0AAW1ILT8_SAPOF